jgi:hypothetical protein
MALLSGLLPAVLLGVPCAYQLDCSVLPLAGTVADYDFDYVIYLDGKPTAPAGIKVGEAGGPKTVAQGLMAAMSGPKWCVKRDGERVTIYSYDNIVVTKIVVTGEGPKPLVRRVPNLPPEKK